MVWGERASERISARGIVVPQSDTAVFAASVTSVLLINPIRVLYTCTLSNIPHHLIDARSTEIIDIVVEEGGPTHASKGVCRTSSEVWCG